MRAAFSLRRSAGPRRARLPPKGSADNNDYLKNSMSPMATNRPLSDSTALFAPPAATYPAASAAATSGLETAIWVADNVLDIATILGPSAASPINDPAARSNAAASLPTTIGSFAPDRDLEAHAFAYVASQSILSRSRALMTSA